MTGERRTALVTTAVALLLVAAGVFALWPRTVPARANPGPAPTASDAQLAGPRAAAALPPCPAPGVAASAPAGAGSRVTGTAARNSDATGPGAGRPAADAPRAVAVGGAPARGPLAGVVVACLGAPGSVDLGAALAGRTTLVNVWASWCAPCRAELPVLAAYAGRPGAAAVLGVDMNDDPRAALALLADLRVRLPAVSASADVLRPGLGALPGLPMSFVVRPDGGVARVDPPVPFASAAEVAAAVTRLS